MKESNTLTGQIQAEIIKSDVFLGELAARLCTSARSKAILQSFIDVRVAELEAEEENEDDTRKDRTDRDFNYECPS